MICLVRFALLIDRLYFSIMCRSYATNLSEYVGSVWICLRLFEGSVEIFLNVFVFFELILNFEFLCGMWLSLTASEQFSTASSLATVYRAAARAEAALAKLHPLCCSCLRN